MKETLEEMQQAAFQIIAHAGDARSHYVEAMRLARSRDFEGAKSAMASGDKAYNQIHKVHVSFIQREATGEMLPFSLLLAHAEDQMLSSETIKIMASEFLALCTELLPVKIDQHSK
ncbi:PTS lactose/cellobiose transporter subunit IIA [Virgibacillus sp. 7505]|uniref:PTS lactose/cellobiose transporter subunit IIA n=1 Tax=Virgibacillus sp. 7505 TaxID=2022548 RepID=UPI00256FBCCC|nr:PTS lactose/cellobiose transporter subunit IIA [Virgibacillus sp. 7505]